MSYRSADDPTKARRVRNAIRHAPGEPGRTLCGTARTPAVAVTLTAARVDCERCVKLGQVTR